MGTSDDIQNDFYHRHSIFMDFMIAYIYYQMLRKKLKMIKVSSTISKYMHIILTLKRKIKHSIIL